MNARIASMVDSALAKLRENWRSRAQEYRAIALHFRNSESRQKLLTVADQLDRMALEVGHSQASETDHKATTTSELAFRPES